MSPPETLPIPESPSPPAPRRWWIRRHWKRLGVGFLLTLIVAFVVFSVPRRTAAWVRSHGGTLSCEKDKVRTVHMVSWVDSNVYAGAFDHYISVYQAVSFCRTDAEITGVSLLDSKLGTDDLFSLKRLTGLHSVAVNGRQLGPGLDVFRDLPELKHLSVSHLSPGQLSHLNRLPQLEFVDIWNQKTSNIGIESLAELPRLKTLFLGDCTVTGELLRSLPELPILECLNLQHCTQFNNDDLQHVGRLKQLQSIHISCADITINDTGIEHMSPLKHLKTLSLCCPWGDVTDAGLAKLATMRSLQEIHIRRFYSTPEQIDRLKRAVPKCQVILR